MIAGSSFIYLFTIVCVILFSNIYQQENYLNKLDQRNASIEKEMGNLSAQLNKMDFVKSYLANRRKPLIVFTQLEKMTPENISISSVTIDEQDKVSIRGQAMQLSDVFKFISTLEQVNYFKKVETKSTRKKKVKDKDLTDFELTFQLTL
jgi:Tfp pilus assembly protein PilN